MNTMTPCVDTYICVCVFVCVCVHVIYVVCDCAGVHFNTTYVHIFVLSRVRVCVCFVCVYALFSECVRGVCVCVCVCVFDHIEKRIIRRYGQYQQRKPLG